MSEKSKSERTKFEVRYEYVPSKDAEERLLRAFAMVFLEDGELAPEFKVAEKAVEKRHLPSGVKPDGRC